MNRRHFTHSALASIGVMAWPTITHSSQKTSLRRPADSKFKFSLAAYSYRSLLSGDSPKLSLKDFLDDCAKFGLDGAELTSYYFPREPTDKFIYDLKSHAFRQGLDVSGTAIGNDFGHTDPAKRKTEISHTKQWIEFAEKMGAPVIRVFAGHQKQGSTAEQSHKLMVSALEECCEYAGQHGIHLAIENHGGPTATAAGLLRFVRDVKSRWFGINLDTGNFHTPDIYGDLEKVAPHAINVQVKVITSGPDQKKIPTDFDRLAHILNSSKYRGYIVLEYEEKGDPRSESERYLEKIRDAFT
ncbi:MAG: sugar phosphate isomerase/epimerase family protein [Planctomycetota bacterium]|nr:sugar phosphate isomerase/epimerase family protein [Planctomycetota bacterium]